MKSPFFNSNVGGGWGPPANLAQVHAQRHQELQEAGKAIGALAGSVGAGAVGAFQGANNPGVFGPTKDGQPRSSTNGAFLGFAQNFSASQGNGPNVEQLKTGSKAAKGVFDFFAGQIPMAGDQEPNVFGMTKSQFDVAGAREQIAWMQGLTERMQQQAAVQGYKKGQQDMMLGAARLRRINQETESARQTGPALSTFAQFAGGRPLWSTGEGAGLAPSGAATPTLPEAFGAALRAHPQADPRTMVSAFAQFADAAPFARAPKVPETMKVGDRTVVFSPATGAFQFAPEAPAPKQATVRISQNPLGFGEDVVTVTYPTVEEARRAGVKLPGDPSKRDDGAASTSHKAEGGYKINTVYGGLRYLGGDPNNSANWEKAR